MSAVTGAVKSDDLTGVLLTSVRSVGATRDRNARYRGSMEVFY